MSRPILSLSSKVIIIVIFSSYFVRPLPFVVFFTFILFIFFFHFKKEMTFVKCYSKGERWKNIQKRQRHTCEAKQFEDNTERCFVTKPKRSQMLCDDWKIKISKWWLILCEDQLVLVCVRVEPMIVCGNVRRKSEFVTRASNYNEMSFVYAMYFIFFDYFLYVFVHFLLHEKF